jgi:5'-nucleotidase
LLNVNVPPLAPETVKGFFLAHQGRFRHVDDLEPHAELDDHYGYVLDSPSHPEVEDPDSDVERVKAGYVAVSPLHLDLTARLHWREFESWNWKSMSDHLAE